MKQQSAEAVRHDACVLVEDESIQMQLHSMSRFFAVYELSRWTSDSGVEADVVGLRHALVIADDDFFADLLLENDVWLPAEPCGCCNKRFFCM